MSGPRPPHLASLEELDRFDTVIDVRSPAEYAQDHIPGAINLPVLDDAQRAQVGTLYAQVSPFEARKRGAALVARNIADHLERALGGHPKTWKPLVYCWRGGQRSGAMTLVLNQVGWAARQLEGGYRAFRRQVIHDLEEGCSRFRFIVLHGPTGSGKTALLEALGAAGAQVLDLEALARHRGSVLGGAAGPEDAPDNEEGPASAQPGQKAFETGIWQALRGLDPLLPVYVESESRRIGKLSIPPGLFEQMVGSPCLRIAAPLEARVAHLVERYGDIYRRPAELRRRLAYFLPLVGHKTVEEWESWIEQGRWADLARAMIDSHYDPAYRRGGNALYRRAGAAELVALERLDRDAIIAAARAILQSSGTGNADQAV